MSAAASPCPSPTLGPSGSGISTHPHELLNTNSIIANSHTRHTPLKSPIFPSELRSPLISSFSSTTPSSTMSATTTITTLITQSPSSSSSLKPNITPPSAYTAFLQSAITHASASNTPTSATFNLTEVVKSPRYLPGMPNEGAKVPLSPMYTEFLKHHFAHAIQPTPRRFRASVSGPAMRWPGGSTRGKMDPPRSPGLVMLGNAGIINGSLKNKEAILRARAARAAGSETEMATEVKSFATTPGSGSTLPSVPPSGPTTATSTIDAPTGGTGGKITVVKVEGSPAVTPISPNTSSLGGRNDGLVKEDRKRASDEERDEDDNTDIKESTVEVSEGKAVRRAMNLMPAPKGKRRRVE